MCIRDRPSSAHCSASASLRRVANPCHFLRQNVLHNLPVHIREPIVTALETEGQLLVIESKQVHDRRLQIMDVNFVLDDGKSEFVRLAVGDAGPHTTAREENGESIGKVIAPKNRALSRAAFAERCAPCLLYTSPSPRDS